MKKFLRKAILFLLFILLPVLLSIVCYIVCDPFKVVHKYSKFSPSETLLNRDYVSIETLLKTGCENNYDSFVFGSSRVVGFSSKSWSNHIKSKSILYLDASLESVCGIFHKLKLLDSCKASIANTLIVLDRDCSFKKLRNEDFNGHLFIKHPKVTKQSFIKFNYIFYKAFINPGFLFSYFIYKMTNIFYPFMSGFLNDKSIEYDPITNEILFTKIDDLIQRNKTEYYKDKDSDFYVRPKISQVSDPIITAEGEAYLREISLILQKNKTNYRVILSPLFEEVKWSPKDLLILKTIFKSKYVFDFSGKTVFSQNKENYYESSHYRKNVGDLILDSAYKEVN